jgi:hypothetical protein
MSEKHTFRGVIEATGSGGAFVTVPFDVEQAFGKKRVPIHATFDGVPYRGSLVRMGGPSHLLPILKEIREAIGKQPGDEVEITLEEDTAIRTVEVPPDLAAGFESAPVARANFEKLAYTHRREYVRWIEEAKREQTRKDRVARALEMLAEGKKLR